ncbi:MAG: elongator complex protein 3, partial [Oceanicoccus sp.]
MKVLTEETILKSFIKQAVEDKISTEDQLHKMKKRFAREHGFQLPSNFKLQVAYKTLIDEGWEGHTEFQKLIRKRKVRTLSGVTVITVLTKPYPCPGECVFCPTEPGMPKSYLSNEPGAMRAVLDDFHPRDQVNTRLDSLTRQGHETEKIEMIVLGGTFSSYVRTYQSDYIQALYNACNEDQSDSLEGAQVVNETSKHKIIGLSLETRPDHITEEEIANMRNLGCTKVQIGVQHTDNAILELNKRGEVIEDTISAMKLLKDAGLKVAVHLMPNLPGSTPEVDLAMVKDFFENPAFKPDHLKIYPCVVTPFAELEQWWKEGRYKAYSDEVLMNLLIEMQRHLPEYVRVERLFRDIPGESILEGSQKTNMRQIIEKIMDEKGIVCSCIRCREIKGESYDADSTELRVHEYEASEGVEFFISFNDKERDKICSLLRLRFPSMLLKNETHFIPELTGASIVREVHTYGAQVKTGDRNKKASQHAGLGRRMLEEA